MARTQASVHQQPLYPEAPEHQEEAPRRLRLVPSPSLMAPPEDDPAKPPQQHLDGLVVNPDEPNAKPPQQDLDGAQTPDPDPPSDR